jgi:hypothetical protein
MNRAKQPGPPNVAEKAATSLSVLQLRDYLLDGPPADTQGGELSDWLVSSRRFRAFARDHRDKIRKKLRSATEAEARRDVCTELHVARLLLADSRIDLAFEARGVLKGGPDFVVSFRGERDVNLEVTRLHGGAAGANPGGPLLAKLRQLPPSAPNVLLIAMESQSPDTLDAAAAARSLKMRAESGDEAFFMSRGFGGTREFHQRFLRLGCVITWDEAAAQGTGVATWTNTSARIPVPERVLRACADCLRKGSA